MRRLIRSRYEHWDHYVYFLFRLLSVDVMAFECDRMLEQLPDRVEKSLSRLENAVPSCLVRKYATVRNK